ncbi:hypothetical protein M4I33_13140 [Clostridium sp. LY3-2]|uniref:hypothetical protein n=1 Tax=Clostridium sp. LY3-2 TaxID=2942482 RepID=UPI0021529D89|nr:hypothetical protein [Clostridium sp. LY3-2]MCR6515815.1 hypothetical protein [Clostridium sp. LY3-2]
MLLKLCSYHGCKKIVKDGVSYCEYHSKKYNLEQKKRYKEYKNRRMHNEEQKRFQSFYNSDAWRRLRDVAAKSTLCIDVIEYYKYNKIVQGERVHHIVELSDDYNMRLNIDNLIYLTEKNHRIVHREYNKGNKVKMQELLLNLKLKFIEEYEL